MRCYIHSTIVAVAEVDLETMRQAIDLVCSIIYLAKFDLRHLK